MTRHKGEHLSDAEIATVRQAFVEGRRPKEAALLVSCSPRIAMKYYGFFRAEGRALEAKAEKEAPQPKPFDRRAHYDARHYRSSFEPS